MNPRLETRVEWGGAAGPSLRDLIGAARVRLDPEGVRAAFGEIEATGATCIAGARWAWPTPTRRAELRPLAELLAQGAHLSQRVLQRLPGLLQEGAHGGLIVTSPRLGELTLKEV